MCLLEVNSFLDLIFFLPRKNYRLCLESYNNVLYIENIKLHTI